MKCTKEDYKQTMYRIHTEVVSIGFQG